MPSAREKLALSSEGPLARYDRFHLYKSFDVVSVTLNAHSKFFLFFIESLPEAANANPGKAKGLRRKAVHAVTRTTFKLVPTEFR